MPLMLLNSLRGIGRLLGLAGLLTGLAGVGAFAQAQSIARKDNSLRAQTPWVTAGVTVDQVRYLAPLGVFQLRVEIYDLAGNRIYDSGPRFGNQFDWEWLDQQGQPLADGSYHTLVTMKDFSGQTSQRFGVVGRQGEDASLQIGERGAIGVREPNLLAAIERGEWLTAYRESASAMLSHDGRQARLSSRGDLGFFTGDFFIGKDVERMRLTAEGNLGIGIDSPQTRLDVGGWIRTSEGVVFPDGTVQRTAAVFGGGRPMPGRSATGANAQLAGVNPGVPKETEVDGIFDNIIMTPTDFGGGLRIADIKLNANTGGLRFTATPGLTASPDGAAIQFWGNNSAFPGNLFLDGGARDGASLIFRTAGSGQIITERMRVTSNGNVGIGLNNPGSLLTVAGLIQSTSGGFRFPDGTTQTTAATGGGGGGTITGVTAGTGLSGGGTTGNVTLNLNQTFTDGRYVRKTGDTMTGTLTVQTGVDGYGLVHTNGPVTIGSFVNNLGGWLGTRSNHPLLFFTNDSGALMTLGTNGNLGIGTTTPAVKLEVSGTGESIGATRYGNLATLVGRRANGTPAAPSRILSGNPLAGVY